MTTPSEPVSTPVEPVFTPEVSNDDRLWVLLCFLLAPLLPLITLFLEDKKARPFIKYHNVPALILGVVIGIIVAILSAIPVIQCFAPLVWIVELIYGLKAYKGVNTDVPIITAFSKGQGWS
jgi:uncharacterized membrane protein